MTIGRRKLLIDYVVIAFAFSCLFVSGSLSAQTNVSLSPAFYNLGTGVPGKTYQVIIRAMAFPNAATVNVTSDPAVGTGEVISISPTYLRIEANMTGEFTVNGVFPIANGPFSHLIKFKYWNGSQDITVQTEIYGSTSTNTTPPGTDYSVGVIPNGQTCPPGSPLVTFHMDDEDRNNANGRSGWRGAITSDSNTTFRFCRVDGRQFYPLSSTNSTTNHYAVLSMGTHCPNGSKRFSRYFDNENNDNRNYRSTSSGKSSDYGYNHINGNDTHLYFCLFTSGNTTMTNFPTLGIQYGVFAAPGFSKTVSPGWIYTDDQDHTFLNPNDNAFYDENSVGGRNIVVPIANQDSDDNTRIYLARVTAETKPVAGCGVNPSYGNYAVTATFTGSATASSGRQITGYEWRFSDGSQNEYSLGPHTRSFFHYSGSPGSYRTYTGTLIVTDNYGETASAVCYVTVYMP